MSNVIHVDFSKNKDKRSCDCDICKGIYKKPDVFPLSLVYGLVILVILVGIAAWINFK